MIGLFPSCVNYSERWRRSWSRRSLSPYPTTLRRAETLPLYIIRSLFYEAKTLHKRSNFNGRNSKRNPLIGSCDFFCILCSICKSFQEFVTFTHNRIVRNYQGVTKRCRLSWLTNSALVYKPKCGVIGGRDYGI
jgi:hypothetical protein